MEVAETKVEPVGPKKLKKIEACNDYVVIWIKPMTSEIELPEGAKAAYKNEGVVIGIGPEVNKGVAHDYKGTDYEIKLGDEVVVRGNKYAMINPQHGPYSGDEIMLVHKPDLVYRHARIDPNKFVFADSWGTDDTKQVKEANAK